jgi:biotin carboxylase
MKSLLIANRGEIARRIMRTARRMGLRTVAVYSDADAQALHVREADAAVHRQRGAPRVLPQHRRDHRCANRSGVDFVHPGYGFLAESADFAQAVVDAGLTWVGPPPMAIRTMGDKAGGQAHRARCRACRPLRAPNRTIKAMPGSDRCRQAARLSADDQGRGGRRRPRYAARDRRKRACRGARCGTFGSAARLRRRPVCCWNAR